MKKQMKKQHEKIRKPTAFATEIHTPKNKYSRNNNVKTMLKKGNCMEDYEDYYDDELWN
jgi:hypothetical protein